jgi:hypothetical protein
MPIPDEDIGHCAAKPMISVTSAQAGMMDIHGFIAEME